LSRCANELARPVTIYLDVLWGALYALIADVGLVGSPKFSPARAGRNYVKATGERVAPVTLDLTLATVAVNQITH